MSRFDEVMAEQLTADDDGSVCCPHGPVLVPSHPQDAEEVRSVSEALVLGKRALRWILYVAAEEMAGREPETSHYAEFYAILAEARRLGWDGGGDGDDGALKSRPRSGDTTTVTKKVSDLVARREEPPLPLSVIPNYMGINLCSVDSVSWTKQADGQLVELTIRFIPE